MPMRKHNTFYIISLKAQKYIRHSMCKLDEWIEYFKHEKPNTMNLYIKNMACECCKTLVKEKLENMGLHVEKIDQGEAVITETISSDQLKNFNEEIKQSGLEIIENKKGILLERIKNVIHDYVFSKTKLPFNFSAYASKQLNYDYTYLSNFFSEMEASTIEQYIISLKIDRVKEMIVLDDMSLTEIADLLHYSSVAHLSNQFKKVTGLTPSHFKELRKKRAATSPEFLRHHPSRDK